MQHWRMGKKKQSALHHNVGLRYAFPNLQAAPLLLLCQCPPDINVHSCRHTLGPHSHIVYRHDQARYGDAYQAVHQGAVSANDQLTGHPVCCLSHLLSVVSRQQYVKKISPFFN